MLAAWTAAAAAQTLPPQLPPQLDPGQQQRRAIEQLERLEPRPPTPAAPVAPVRNEGVSPDAPSAVPAAGPGFELRSVSFDASTWLDAASLDAIAARYVGRRVDFAALSKLVDEVNALYLARGVRTARALLPPQTVRDGAVRVQLVEARLGDVKVSGAASTNESFVRARVPSAVGQPLDFDALQAALVRLNRTSDLQARAALRPGAEPGRSDLAIELVEPPRQALRLFADNHGAQSTGSAQQGVAYALRSPFGVRDELSATASRAEGRRSYGLGYAIPFNRWGGRASVAYNHDDTRIVGGPFATLGLTGESALWTGQLRQPVWVDATNLLELQTTLRRRSSENFATGTLLQSGELRDQSLGVDWQRFGERATLAVSIAHHRGTAQSAAAERDYALTRASARFTGLMPDRSLLLLSASLQHTSDELLPGSEQFAVGGEGSVRGYRPAIVFGDTGYAVSAEWVRRIGWLDRLPFATRVDGSLFVDHGTADPYRAPGTPGGRERLTGVGVGLAVYARGGVTVRANLARPLSDVPNEPDDLRLTVQAILAF